MLHKRHEMNQISYLFVFPTVLPAGVVDWQAASIRFSRATRLNSPLLRLTSAFAAESSLSCHLFLLPFCPPVLFLATSLRPL
jgi:hypothetical protein